MNMKIKNEKKNINIYIYIFVNTTVLKILKKIESKKCKFLQFKKNVVFPVFFKYIRLV